MPTFQPRLNTNPEAPALDAFVVTPSDTVNFTTNAQALYIGTGGDVSLETIYGTEVTFVGVPTGTILPVACVRVNATGTGASNIVGLL